MKSPGSILWSKDGSRASKIGGGRRRRRQTSRSFLFATSFVDRRVSTQAPLGLKYTYSKTKLVKTKTKRKGKKKIPVHFCKESNKVSSPKWLGEGYQCDNSEKK